MTSPFDRTPIGIDVELNAVIVAVTDETPRILTVRPAAAPQGPAPDERLPSGTLDPAADRTLELGLRRWVREQTGIELGYIEQLYTFGDRDRARSGDRRFLSIAYLALVRGGAALGGQAPAWRPWYEYFPWEDWRDGRPRLIDDRIWPSLASWVRATDDPSLRVLREERVDIAFAPHDEAWNPNRVLDRYEILYEARLIHESRTDAGGGREPDGLGRQMALDHRRIAASALDRLRGKIAYRPVVFELLPETFTLLRLQRVVEALVGIRLHKSNFRRLVEQGQLVERTGALETQTGGRPAELFRFRRDVLRERPAPGVSLPRRAARDR